MNGESIITTCYNVITRQCKSVVTNDHFITALNNIYRDSLVSSSLNERSSLRGKVLRYVGNTVLSEFLK